MAVLWDEEYAGWAVKILIELEWRDYLLGSMSESVLAVFTQTMAFMLVLGLISAVWISKRRPWLRWGLYAASAVLLFESFCKFLDVSYQIPMLIEHTLRICAPAFLAHAVIHGFTQGLKRMMLLAVGLTFAGHSFYAMGAGVPVPANFIDMVIETLRFSQNSAMVYLLIAGILDQIMVAALIPDLSRPAALLYGVFWGFVTSLARLTSYVRLDVMFWTSLVTFLPEFLVRAPHFLIPLALYLAGRKHRRYAQQE